MLPYNARTKDQGFTMIEVIVVLIIIGILSAIMAPSFLSMFNKNKVNDTLEQVRGALREAQREAIRKSKSCAVTLDTTNKKISSPCLVTGDRTLTNGVAILTHDLDGTPPSVTFSMRGSTTNSGLIIVQMSDGSTDKKGCLVISEGPGIMRTGVYNGSTTSISSGNCTTSL